MHEAGIAQNILEIALNEAKKNGDKKITLVSVRIGKMTAIDEASLRFAFDALKVETKAENALFEFQCIPLLGRCLDCGAESELENYFVLCPKCSSGNVKILSGNELEMSHIEVD